MVHELVAALGNMTLLYNNEHVEVGIRSFASKENNDLWKAEMDM